MSHQQPKHKLLNNLDKLLPFAGLVLVFAGVLGAVAVQKPLEYRDSQFNSSTRVKSKQ